MSSTEPGNPKLEEGKQAVREGAERAADEAKSRAESMKSKVGAGAERTAEALHSAADELGARNQQGMAEAVDKLAASLSELASQLQHKSFDELLQEGKALAQRNPVLFIAGSVAAGAMLSRLFIAKPRSDHGSRSHEQYRGVESGHGRSRSGQPYLGGGGGSAGSTHGRYGGD